MLHRFLKRSLNFFRIKQSERVKLRFRCPFRVGIEVLLATRLGQRPQVGRVALLSASVKAYLTSSPLRPDASPAFFFFCLRPKPG